jgi:ribosome-binding factor A
MREFKRQDRLRQQIKTEVADILQRTIKNPRIGFVTVTDVELSKDLKYAKIFYSTLGTAVEKADSARALERTKLVIQAELGKRIRIRQTPVISFHVDKSLDYGDKIDSLLEQIKEEKSKDEQEDD